ncbi:2TM domain-containing protein [Comamonas resistens]|uniref:2TM domain-containing protein n=1 Tax=Comamonas resistens TaxID=3046670 RepID=A0ABY8SNI8_9BURK|nr:2TM domain-containing protein [Comamonas resistens]MDL5037691.1 2TM domain-containing protein [Comamonas resistens]WHS64275.1 2TM domain-containing protein [Comamonas resistens]
MSTFNHTLADSPDEQLKMARRRARMKLGWYLHATVYILVNLGLTTLAALQGRHWAVYPAIFWGLGLAMHGAAVWISSPRSALWTRMVDKELRAMQSLNKK